MADDLDTWAEKRVLALLSRPEMVRRVMPEPVDKKAMRAARDEVARVRAEHDDLAKQVADGSLSARLAATAEPGILARLALAEKQVQELTMPNDLRQLIEPGPKVRTEWDAKPIEVKRQIVALLFTKGLLGLLSVAPMGGGPNTIEARHRLDGPAKKIVALRFTGE